MMTVRARVIESLDHRRQVKVQLVGEGGCHQCAVKSSCLKRNPLRGGNDELLLSTRCQTLQPGDYCEVALDERAILKSALLAYGLPLLGLFTGLAVAGLSHSDSALETLAFCGLGLVIACGAVKKLSLRLQCNPDYHPQILEPEKTESALASSSSFD